MYKIGDRITVIHAEGETRDGMLGTIVEDQMEDMYAIGVEFDEMFYGHDCRGMAKDGFGWFMQISGISPYRAVTYKVGDEFERTDKPDFIVPPVLVLKQSETRSNEVYSRDKKNGMAYGLGRVKNPHTITEHELTDILGYNWRRVMFLKTKTLEVVKP